jgi:hypothetical protein
MTVEDFKVLIETRTDLQLVHTVLHGDDLPFVFNNSAEAWNSFRNEFVTALSVSESDVRIVGSARFGFSMKPGLNLRAVRDTSDIDVIIVNSHLFDQLWLALLRAVYPRPPHTSVLSGWLARRKNELYTGWLTPLDIKLDLKIYGNRAKPVLDINAQWFAALKKASRHPPMRHEDIAGRLYRTWEHAELYHLHGITELRRSLTNNRSSL